MCPILLRSSLAKRTLSAVLASSLLVATGCTGSTPGSGIEQLLVLKSELSELQKVLSETIGQADQATANNINRARDGVKQSIDQIDKVMKDTSKEVAIHREEAARQAFRAIGFTEEEADKSGQTIFSRVNETLASSAAIISAVPFVNVPDTVFAVTPYRMRADSRDSEIEVFGYFPSLNEDPDAVVVTIDDKPVKIKRSAGKLFFDLPPSILQSQKRTADISISLPKKHWYSKHPTPIAARIHILNPQPYRFEVGIAVDNPAAVQTVVGSPHQDTTNNNSSPHYDATALFNLTVPDTQRFEPSTAKFVNIQTVGLTGGKACGGCPDPSGRVTRWDENTIDLALNAPSCGFTMFQCNGGGSHYEVTIVPTFNVRVKGVPDSIPSSTKQVVAGWSSVSKIDLPDKWASAIVTMRYDDNFDHKETFIVVKPTTPVAAAPLFDARVENHTQLLIAAR